MSKIITELSSDMDILSRWEEEHPRVIRWAKKHIHNNTLEFANFTDKPLKVLNQNLMTFEPYVARGIIPWVSPQTGDTWATAVFDSLYSSNSMSIDFYYWNTVASIGFVICTEFGTIEHSTPVLSVFSSHCMLRYKDRLKLDRSGFELITHILGRTYQNIPYVYEKNGRETFEIICADGVFRAAVNDRRVCIFKTFLAWEDLPKKELKERKELWDGYQEIFSK